MLKTWRNDTVWLVTQPDHAEVSGYMAAHWGNDDFAQPGYYAKSVDPERLRTETVLGIAQHDNGWWEWEAAPDLSEVDGLPMGLSEFMQDTLDGMDRWWRGISRFSQNHPYASLLIAFHAYWIYARNFEIDSEPAFSHPLFSKEPSPNLMADQLDGARRFTGEIKDMQEELSARLGENPESANWGEPEHLKPHVRLLQVLDGLSLSLCCALVCPLNGEARGLGEDAFDLYDVPRRNWEDRVTMELRPVGRKRIACNPYPFDLDPLTVHVPVRVLTMSTDQKTDYQVYCHSQQKQFIQYQYCSA